MNESKIKFRDLLNGTEFEEKINKLISDTENKAFGDLGKNGFEHSSKVEEYLDKLLPDEIKKGLDFIIYEGEKQGTPSKIIHLDKEKTEIQER